MGSYWICSSLFDTWVSDQRRQFLVVFGLGIRGNIRHMILSISSCLVNCKVGFDDNIIDYILLC